MRHRFKTSRVCSSDNYSLSMKVSRKYNPVFFIGNEKPYIKIFGKLLNIEGMFPNKEQRDKFISENESDIIYK